MTHSLAKYAAFFIAIIMASCGVNSTTDDTNYIYHFSARVSSSKIEDAAWGAAKGKYKKRVLTATIVGVFNGADIKSGQKVVIQMKSLKDNCQIGAVCNFVAPYKHPAIEKYTYLLDAKLK